MSTQAASPVVASGGVAVGGARHVAIIMDGNGRWAKKRFLPRLAGHRAGIEAVRRTITAAGEIGLQALTLYAFSSENWRRPATEVSDLMGLLGHYLRREIDALDRNNVQLRLIGEWRKFEADLVNQLLEACERLSKNDGLIVTLALNYGAQDELVRAMRKLAEEARAGAIDPETIDTQAIEARLDTADLPPLDLVIRTSGESRLSNFLLWQAAYAELLFTETLWPDFDRAALESALECFVQRERRFGGL
ncbi:undecaprenyl diphosphate synthase [Sphingomonas vulcanisoli]|uniref:Isoprenyl transferase n=1 Tax=Sphingomonas vulcanisoli TaxID=1658060 RepID=A0ABX0TQU9_9SPHN|nr:undecaprenyl diphosphate synthase [Sphingomonas vulcanisoli]